MTNPVPFSGVYTALVTPFTDDGQLDEAGLRRLVRRQIAGGVAGLVPCGTTGEAVTLDLDEHERVVAITAEEVHAAGRRVQVIAGCGSNDTRKSQRLAARCRAAGADALLVVTPYYNKPTPRGLVAHFTAVADAGQIPVVVYNVPGRTGVNMLPDTVLELARDPRIAGVKEASGSLEQACEILRARPTGFSVLSGEDSLALPIAACGGDGVIAVVSNEAPALLVELVASALAGDRSNAAALQARLLPLMKANFRESNPIPVKWALERLGLVGGALRLPLVPLSPAHHGPLEEALKVAGLLDEAGRPVGSGGRVTREDVFELLDALERGDVRAAAPGPDGFWVANATVKEGILAAFRLGIEEPSGAGALLFRDRDTLPPRAPLPEGVRVVPGGTALRRGSFLAKGVVVMPPAYVNVGAYVDEGSMIDSHALVGSCAQVGRRVHLSAAAQVGGVLEPAGAVPVVLEDEVFVGGGAGVYEGVCVRRRAVLAAGVILTASSVLFDLVHEKELRSTPERPLVVPEGAVVVMGSRPAPGAWGKCHGLSLAAPVIVKYRDAKTDARTVLESALR